jgi:hypothetical protein
VGNGRFVSRYGLRRVATLVTRDSRGSVLICLTQQTERPGYDPKGTAGTKDTSSTSKWSRRMHTHILNRCTIALLLDQQEDESDWRQSTSRAVKSVRSINVRTSAPAELPHSPLCSSYHTTGQERKNETAKRQPSISMPAHRIKSSLPVISHQIHTAADQAVHARLQDPPVEEAAPSPYPEGLSPQSPPE